MKKMFCLFAALLTLSTASFADGLYQDNYKSPDEAVDGHAPHIQMNPTPPPQTLPETTHQESNQDGIEQNQTNNTYQDNNNQPPSPQSQF